MKIGRTNIAHAATQAPMEEHSHYYFRRLMREHGASLVMSERVDAQAVAGRDRRALRLLATAADEAPRGGQISSSEPATMAEAARVVEELGFDLVDLNFDCPIARLLARGEAGALMSDPAAIERIAAAVVKAVGIPVTVKIRSGPDESRQTAVEVARRAEAAGVAAISVHARSVAQAYRGAADWRVITQVREAVGIPVLGGGGIREAKDAVRLLSETGAAGVAIGRGCLGNPWIFRDARALVAGGRPPSPPSLEQRGRALARLVEGEFRHYGNVVAVRRLPRVAGYFAAALADQEAFRGQLGGIRRLDQFRRLVRQHFR